jgi:predicted PurR-regulated permease PerM
VLSSRLIEYVFFFGLLGVVAYLAWKLIAPFAATLALAAIVVTICYPLYERVLIYMPRRNRTLASFVSVLLVLLVVIVPIALLGSLLLREAASIYSLFSSSEQFSLERSLADLEQFIQTFIPAFTLDITSYVQQFANFVAEHVTSIFAGTATTLFLFFISLIAIFYFFRDGQAFTKFLVQISPLPDAQDEKILKRLAVAIRSVAIGTVLVALIQGTVTGIGLSLFGFDRAVLWGSVAAIGALIPGVGTTIVFIPAVVYLIATGDYLLASGVALWGALAVGFIDNLLGPYLISRGNKLHPFLILISVLGGIVLFGPIGFVLGPVILSLFAVLLELYALHLTKPQ